MHGTMEEAELLIKVIEMCSNH